MYKLFCIFHLLFNVSSSERNYQPAGCDAVPSPKFRTDRTQWEKQKDLYAVAMKNEVSAAEV